MQKSSNYVAMYVHMHIVSRTFFVENSFFGIFRENGSMAVELRTCSERSSCSKKSSRVSD